MSSSPLISITYWNHFIRYCHEVQIDIAAFLKQENVNPGDDFVTVDQLKRLALLVLEETQEPWYGLKVGKGIHLSSHGSLGFGLSHAKDLRQCLDLLVQYYLTRLQITEMRGEIEGGDYILSIRATTDWQPIEHTLYEAVISGVMNIIGFAVGFRASECEIALPYPKPDWFDQYELLLGCQFKFDQPTAQVRVPGQLLSVPCVSSNPKTVDLATSQCDMELARLDQYDTLAEKVIVLVENSIGFNLSIEAAAKQLNMSKSTLIRRLKQEQTSFKAIVENLKKFYARQLLKESDMTVEVIALKLGYEDVSNFGRSCKRWFGCSPSAYREGMK